MSATEPVRPAPRARFVVRHPVAAFLVIALPLAYGVMGIPLLARYGLIPGRDLPARTGIDLEEVASFMLVVVIFLTALAITRITEGPQGVRVLLRRMTRWRVGPAWWLVVTALPVGTVLLAVVLGDRAHLPAPATIAGEVEALAVAFLAANLGEEATWAGFLQTRLERRHGFAVAAALTAVPFALVHLPLRVISGEVTTARQLAAGFGALLVLCLLIRVLVGAVVRGAANSVLLAAVTHTFFNRSNNADGLAADVLTGTQRQGAALLTALLLTAVLVVVLARRHRLSRTYRHRLDAAEQQPVTPPTEPMTSAPAGPALTAHAHSTKAQPAPNAGSGSSFPPNQPIVNRRNTP